MTVIPKTAPSRQTTLDEVFGPRRSPRKSSSTTADDVTRHDARRTIKKNTAPKQELVAKKSRQLQSKKAELVLDGALTTGRATTTTTACNDERVVTDVLLAIKPVHLADIVSRQKNHEYRMYRLRDGVTRLWLYETQGGKGCGAITHIAVIDPSTRYEPGQVPTEPFGIGNEEFNAGLKKSKYGYPVRELYELVERVTLPEMMSEWGMRSAPMGWQYVKADLWEDRWGRDEEGREKRARKLFGEPVDERS